MACSPTTGSADTGYSGSARPPLLSITKPGSTRRSTRWPIISSAISIATRCSAWHASPSQSVHHRNDEGENGDLRRAGGAIEAERGTDVARTEVAPTIADPGLLDHPAIIDPRPG